MATKNLQKNIKNLDPSWFIAISALVISLYINPSLADPFNSPKLWALIILGSWLLGFIIIKLQKQWKIISSTVKVNLLAITLFLFTLFFSALSSDLKFTAFIGEQQRRLGFIFYFFMAIFMISAALFLNINNLNKIYKSAVLLACIFSIYGFLQSSGADFIDWENPYNSIILTLGNPNYASALMSILAILTLSYSVKLKIFPKLIVIILGILLLALITLSNSRQGLIAFGFGGSFTLLAYVFKVRKKIALMLLALVSPIFVLTILAMLQIGPLTAYIYKASVSIRGYYWRAGFEMLKSNIYTGVGVDNYGEYFRKFREKNYPLTYGFQITSDNAHNVPIQLFATAGIFTGIFYLLITFFIFIRGIKAVKIANKENLILVVGIFGAWVAFQSQSIISIDNVGLTIWGWILGGILVGLSVPTIKITEQSNINSQSRVSNGIILIQQKLISAFLAFVSILLCSLLFQGEKYLYQVTNSLNFNSPIQSEVFNSNVNNLEKAKLVEPAYKFRLANIYFQSGNLEKAKLQVEKLLQYNPDNFDYLFGYTQILTYESNWPKVIETRKKIISIDPWNADNYLQLAKAYESFGDKAQALNTYEKILEFAEGKSQAKEAQQAIDRISNT
jgi:O-antigen ligase